MRILLSTTIEFLICSPPRLNTPKQGHEAERLPGEQAGPPTTPMIASGTISQTSSVVRIELNRQTTMNTMIAST